METSRIKGRPPSSVSNPGSLTTWCGECPWSSDTPTFDPYTSKGPTHVPEHREGEGRHEISSQKGPPHLCVTVKVLMSLNNY